jgi:hypothetical protein
LQQGELQVHVERLGSLFQYLHIANDSNLRIKWRLQGTEHNIGPNACGLTRSYHKTGMLRHNKYIVI